jgi:hypothetical protein
VAIGVRFKVPIFSYENVLSEAGIVIEDESEGGGGESQYSGESSEFSLAEIEKSDPVEEEDRPSSRSRTSQKERLKRLQKQLDEALAGEDYEAAARFRDEIRQIEEGS